ncbi:MAG TPA: twin-arginine translocation signal domain-containing protein [Bacteroidetes bacterium]|nr:twin-arginine translocation signal domain-containing protein [Bacteroidota bacterium]
MSVTRREFLKLTAASAAASAIGSELMVGSAVMGSPAIDWHKSVCRFCGTGCGVMLGTRNGKAVAVKGDRKSTVNRGLLCVKGFYLHKIVHAKNRLLQPLVRKNGTLQPASWDEAMSLVAEKFSAIIKEHGPDAVAFYGSGQGTTEETYIANKLFKGHLSTNNFEGNPRLCMASAVGGYLTSFGADEPVGTYDDIEHAELFLLIGSNTAEAHPVLFDRLVARKKNHPSTKIITIDPRKTPTNKIVDLHLQVIPGYDLAVMHAIARILIKEGYTDEKFISESVTFSDGKKKISYEGYKRFLEKFTPEYAAEKAGIDPQDIVKAARMFGEAKTAMSMWTMGVNQRTRGVWLNNLMHNIHLLTGKLGKPGCDSFSLTGQPNACGGVREGGGLCHLLPGHRKVAVKQHREEIAAIWNVPASNIKPKPGKHTMAMFSAIAAGEIKAAYIMCTNPAHSLPNLNKYLQGLKDCFLVVADSFHPTETTKLADVVLPAAFWGEKEGVYGCTERRSQHMAQAIQPQGQARWDGEILMDLARRLGHGKNFEHFKTPEDVWTEYITTTKGRDMDLTGAPYSRLRKVRGLRWPVPDEKHPGTWHRFTEEDPLFPKEKAKGRRMYFYNKPDGRAVVFARPDKGPEEPVDAEYPLVLSTGRVLEHWHTMTMTGSVKQLVRAVPQPYVEINPEDAKELGFADKDTAIVETRRGELKLMVRVIDRPRKGTIFIPWHWPEKLANLLTTDAIDPGSKEPEYKICAARIRKA